MKRAYTQTDSLVCTNTVLRQDKQDRSDVYDCFVMTHDFLGFLKMCNMHSHLLLSAHVPRVLRAAHVTVFGTVC